MTDNVRRLLGGYATGTLTDDERRALFEAALEDQTLFEALAEEEALRELLADAAARSALLQATESAKFTFGGALREWLERPKAKALAAVGAVLVLAIAVNALRVTRTVTQHAVVLNAPVQPQEPAPASVPFEPEKKAAKTSAGRGKLAATTPSQPPADAPSPDALTVVAADGGVELRYTVLASGDGREYVPVPADHAFSPAERARLRIETNAPGTLAVTRGDEILYTGPMSPGSPVAVAHEILFSDAREQTLQVRFSPGSGGALLMRSPVPAAPSYRQSRPEPAREKSGAAVQVPQQERSVSVRITLRSRQP